ncbi:MAG: hypothetical protein EPN47_07345 [Acidobacteria bacterium]|nr:MAG: hypothetical protein EPN47_07345 [Acidobacteriota bacterium]
MVALFLSVFAISAAAWAEQFHNVPLVDANCAGKVKANPDAHTRACELQCQKSGLGIIAADGKFLKFDAKGDAEAIDLLSKSTKADHLRVNVTGKVADGTLTVQSISME